MKEKIGNMIIGSFLIVAVTAILIFTKFPKTFFFSGCITLIAIGAWLL